MRWVLRYRYAVPPRSTVAARTRPLAIRLLGPLEIVVAGAPIVVDTRKALAIVALVAAEGRPFARDELAAMFWPEADDEAARGALRRTLSALRTAVGDAGLLIERTRVALDPAQVSVDLADVERLAVPERRTDLEAAAALARGPFLAGFALRDSPAFDDWQATRAARVERTVGAVLERLGAARAAEGDAAGAIEAARSRVDLDPLDEPGQRRLIELLVQRRTIERRDPPVPRPCRVVRSGAGGRAAARNHRPVRGDPRPDGRSRTDHDRPGAPRPSGRLRVASSDGRAVRRSRA